MPHWALELRRWASDRFRPLGAFRVLEETRQGSRGFQQGCGYWNRGLYNGWWSTECSEQIPRGGGSGPESWRMSGDILIYAKETVPVKTRRPEREWLRMVASRVWQGSGSRRDGKISKDIEKSNCTCNQLYQLLFWIIAFGTDWLNIKEENFRKCEITNCGVYNISILTLKTMCFFIRKPRKSIQLNVY